MPAKKGKAKPKRQTKNVSGDEAEQMFQLWIQIRNIGKGGGFKGVAAEFGRSRSTVIRVSKRHRWEERHQEIQRRLHIETDKKIETAQVKNLNSIRALRSKLLLELLQSNNTTGGKIVDVVRLINLEGEIIGKLPDDEPKEADIDKKEAQEALAILKTVSPGALDKMAENLVRSDAQKIDDKDDDKETSN